MPTLNDRGQEDLQLEMPAETSPRREAVNADATAAARPRHTMKAILGDMFTTRLDKSTARLGLVALVFVGLYGLIGGRLIYLGVTKDEQESVRSTTRSAVSVARPTILDRNGEIMAQDIRTVSIFAEPHRIVDKDEAAEMLNAVFPDMTGRELRDRLTSRRNDRTVKFSWIKREVSPAVWAQVHRLGIPGIGFVPENKRVYPNANVAAHVLGFADIDNVGIAGIEKWIDSNGLNDLKGAGFAAEAQDLKPVQRR
jgi:cell division protein FtsI (penicillin-binding protein 3)